MADTNNNQQSGGGTINQINSVTATIKKKNTSAPVLTAGGGSYAVYTGSPYYAKAANANGNPAGIIYYGETPGSKTYSNTASTTSANLDKMSRTDVGTTTIHAYFEPTDRSNYNDSPDAITTVFASTILMSSANDAIGSIAMPATNIVLIKSLIFFISISA